MTPATLRAGRQAGGAARRRRAGGAGGGRGAGGEGGCWRMQGLFALCKDSSMGAVGCCCNSCPARQRCAAARIPMPPCPAANWAISSCFPNAQAYSAMFDKWALYRRQFRAVWDAVSEGLEGKEVGAWGRRRWVGGGGVGAPSGWPGIGSGGGSSPCAVSACPLPPSRHAAPGYTFYVSTPPAGTFRLLIGLAGGAV